MAKKRKNGRSKGSHNRGYWFRKDRGWFVTEGKSAIPLRDVKGNHIKNADYGEEAKEAYARYVLQAGEPSNRTQVTVLEVCRLYLDSVESQDAT